MSSNDAAPTAKPAVKQESAQRLARPLIRLAQACGVATSYIDQLGAYVEIADDVLVDVLASLGIDASTPEAVDAAILDVDCRNRGRLVPPTIIATVGSDTKVTIRAARESIINVSIAYENGETWQVDVERDLVAGGDDFGELTELTIPADLPIGYHTLSVQAGGLHRNATIIAAPKRIELPKAVREHQRWGWMVQMYSVRSKRSWGVGDYGDLHQLAVDAADKSGADFMLINPIHASAPLPPLEPSPYLPESRRFINVTYIRPQDIEEYENASEEFKARIEQLHAQVEDANVSTEPLDINAAWSAKRAALEEIFALPRTAERQAKFEAFKQAAGPDLDAFATWCVAFEVWGAPWEGTWFEETGRDSPKVAALLAEHKDAAEFYRWMQWIADEQVSRAHNDAKAHGMALGLMQDMAVGVHALGADVWWSPERFADGVTVGAPPDFYNQLGQDWGQPPFNPQYLEQTGYRVYRELVHSVFAHAGALRIDHILGLFRLWWIPRGRSARDGAYVSYNYNAMLSVLAIEATRANGVVIGEDLGTVPDFVRGVLEERGVLGTDVTWFSRVDNSPNAGDPYAPPSDYRKLALASVTTHDLPPTSGYLSLEHVKLREELHQLNEPVEQFRAEVESEISAMLDLLIAGGYLQEDVREDVLGNEQKIVEAMHAMLLDALSVLVQVALVDGTGETQVQNQPGTSSEYSNWRVPLKDHDGKIVLSDEVFDHPRVKSLSAVMNR